MNDVQIRAMLSDIVEEVDYDIWKEMYNPDTAEFSEDVDTYYFALVQIVKKYIVE